MLKALQKTFQELFANEEAPEEDNAKELAAAGLMLEIATIDQELEPRELDTLAAEISRQFSVNHDKVQELVKKATERNKEATSLYPFTRYINDHLSPEEKFELLCGMWRVAFADARLDKYEEYMIRKIADLLYISQGDFIRAKHIARPDPQP